MNDEPRHEQLLRRFQHCDGVLAAVVLTGPWNVRQGDDLKARALAEESASMALRLGVKTMDVIVPKQIRVLVLAHPDATLAVAIVQGHPIAKSIKRMVHRGLQAVYGEAPKPTPPQETSP